MKLEFSRQIFLKNTQISNFVRIHPVGVDFFHVDAKTDMTKLIVTLRSSVDAPKNCILLTLYLFVPHDSDTEYRLFLSVHYLVYVLYR
jgi:hypothetical protein